MPTETLPLLRESTVSSVDITESARHSPLVLRSRKSNMARAEKTTPVGVYIETAAHSPTINQRFPQFMPPVEAVREDFSLLEKWDGVVLATTDDTFVARLYGGENGDRPIQAEFSKDEISPEERNQIQEGAPFVWTIGYRHIGATRHRDSVIYFRRLLPWDSGEMTIAETRATDLRNTIGWK